MKAIELRDLTPEELRQKYDDTKSELFNLRMQQATGQLENPVRLRHLRKDVARIRTVQQDQARRNPA